MNKNIYLVGFMGTGKSTVGRILSSKLNREFIETDEVIERRERIKISDIFSQKGEAYFRKLEKEVLKNISREHNLVVSCGGGIVIDKDNVSLMKETGTIICLEADDRTIYERVKKDKTRPLLNTPNPIEKIRSLLNARDEFYKRADVFIDTTGIVPDMVAVKIINNLNDV